MIDHSFMYRIDIDMFNFINYMLSVGPNHCCPLEAKIILYIQALLHVLVIVVVL